MADDRSRAVRQLVGVWVPIGVAAAMFIVLRDVSGLLGSIGDVGGQAFTTSVLAGFGPPGIEDLEEALDLWLRSDEGRAFGALRLLRGFVIADLVFIVAYSWLVYLGLRVLIESRAFVTAIVAAIFPTDLVETLLTLWIIEAWPHSPMDVPADNPPDALLWTMRIIAQLKWAAIAVAAVTALVRWLQQRRERRAAAAAGSGSPPPPGTPPGAPAIPAVPSASRVAQTHRRALFGQSVLAAIFVLLVALPAGGPLQQVPDLIRYQIHGAPIHVLALNVIVQILLAIAIAASGLVGARTGSQAPRSVAWWVVLAAAAGLSALLVLLGVIVDGDFNVPALAPLGLVAAMAIAAGLARAACIHDAAPPAPGAVPHGPATISDPALVWTGALAGAVIVAIGLGAVRAAAPFVLLGQGSALRWWGWGLGGVVVAAVGGGLTAWLVTAAGRALARRRGGPADPVRPAIAVVFAITTVLAAVVAIWPEQARHFGATGALALAFGFFAVVVAGLQVLSRRGVSWEVTRWLGLGPRTPWAAMLIGVWLLSTVLDTSGGYHDIRTLPVPEGEDEHHYEDLAGAVDAWTAAQDLDTCPAGETVPMVLVAAPGGGIRAAYWTATALDNLFPTDCARRRLFAVSGTSGGSVGTVIWQGALDQQVSPTTAIEAISGDEALSATIAGMLLRDLPQPLTALNDGWRDRAALLEDGWIEYSDVLGTVDDPTPWTELGGLRTRAVSGPWIPAFVLNSASVTDGCRILVTSVGELPTSEDLDCLSRTPVVGPSRAALDPLASLADHEGAPCGSRQPPAVTAGLLSARFPYVTPSGTLHHCAPDDDEERVATYAVDGGYYENSGILALLEMLEEIGPMTIGDTPVEPWIVVVDNHFRTNEVVTTSGEPNQLIVPIVTATSSKLDSQSALEQAAATALLDEGATCPRFGRIGPPVSPGMTAPLGWALSEESEQLLDRALKRAIEQAMNPQGDDPGCLAPLLASLGSQVPSIDDD